MKANARLLIGVASVCLLLAALLPAQLRDKGEITGQVFDDDGGPLPGASVTLKGEQLFRPQTGLTNERGVFRFLNLTPGTYELEAALQGFNSAKILAIRVHVGASTPLRVVLSPAELKLEMVVTGSAPLIETKTPQVAHIVDTMLVANTPNDRSYINIMNNAPGFFNGTGYGESGNIMWGSPATWMASGSMTSSFKLNGQEVSSPSAGYSTIYPVLESIQEIQIVGIGATAEYGGYSGATVNVVTKSGSNAWHGSVTGTYTDKRLYAKRFGNQYNFNVRYDVQSSLTLGGPIIKDRLFFFIAPGYAAKDYSYWTGAGDSGYTFARPNYYAKLDFLLNNKNTVSFLWNSNPADQTNYNDSNPVGLYKMPMANNSFFLSLQTILGEKTFGNLRFNLFKDNIDMTPVYPGMPYLSDGIKGRSFGSFYMDRSVYDHRFEGDASLAHYLDEFLGASHELKFGLEYERSYSGEERIWVPMISVSQPSPTSETVVWSASLQGDWHTRQYITSLRGFVQDNVRIGERLNVNAGLRYENPVMTARKFSGNIFEFNILSPRFGFSYDLTGRGKSVVHASLGWYYNKPITQTFQNCAPGRDDAYAYTLETSRDVYNAFDGSSTTSMNQISDLVVRQQNLTSVSTYSIPAITDPDLKQYGTFQASAGLRQELFGDFSLEFDYMYKKGFNRYQMMSGLPHAYEPFQWTDPWLGNTLDFWRWTDGQSDVDKIFANTSWVKNRHHMVFVVLRKRPSHNWSMMLSYVYQNSYSNEPGYGSSDIFGSPGWNFETDPYYYQNSVHWGRAWTRPHQFKLQTSWFAPWGFVVGVSGAAMSEQAGQAMLTYNNLPTSPLNVRRDAALRPYGYMTYILLEQRGIRSGRMFFNFDARVAKRFNIFGSSLEIQVDAFNLLNQDFSYYMNWFYLLTNPEAPRRSGGLLPPRNFRLGLTWAF